MLHVVADVVAVTVRGIALFAAVNVVLLAAAGPEVMEALFGSRYEYGRAGLVVVAVGWASTWRRRR